MELLHDPSHPVQCGHCVEATSLLRLLADRVHSSKDDKCVALHCLRGVSGSGKELGSMLISRPFERVYVKYADAVHNCLGLAPDHQQLPASIHDRCSFASLRHPGVFLLNWTHMALVRVREIPTAK
jgi:hypothetical protein